LILSKGLEEGNDWKNFEKSFDAMWKDKGRPAIDIRLMFSLHYLNYHLGDC